MLAEIERAQLEKAMRESRCTGDLDTALKFPALAIALRNTAQALNHPPKNRQRSRGNVIDFKRACAGDID